jgi:hypothetical protein
MTTEMNHPVHNVMGNLPVSSFQYTPRSCTLSFDCVWLRRKNRSIIPDGDLVGRGQGTRHRAIWNARILDQ